MSRLLQLYEGYQGVFEGILDRLRSDRAFRSLFHSCSTFHRSALFVKKINKLDLLLWDEEANGSVAAQLAMTPRGAHITKLVLLNDTFRIESPFTVFQRGVVSHLSSWRPGMLELGNITALELQGRNFDNCVSGSFAGTLHAAFPHLQHLVVGDRSRKLLAECAATNIQLKSLAVTCDISVISNQSDLFDTLRRLTSLEALTIFADSPQHECYEILAGLNLTSFTWDIPQEGEYEIEFGDFGDFSGVFPSWHKLHTLSLFHSGRRLPPLPASLKCLHVECTESESLNDLHLLPEGLMFNIDMLILDSRDRGAAHGHLTNLQSANVNITCKHLRLLCGDRFDQKGSLCDVLPLLAKRGHLFVKVGTHEVSAIHVKVMPGEVQQLASLFNGISKLGLVDYYLSSLNVLKEAVCLPGLSVLQLRCKDDDSPRACEVQAACIAGQGRQQQLPLFVELGLYPNPNEGEESYIPEWMPEVVQAWNSNVTAGLPVQVTIRDVTCKHKMSVVSALDDIFF